LRAITGRTQGIRFRIRPPTKAKAKFTRRLPPPPSLETAAGDSLFMEVFEAVLEMGKVTS
jgi:hypothetical protein